MKPELVRLGDNHVVEAQGIGNVRISVVLDDGQCPEFGVV